MSTFEELLGFGNEDPIVSSQSDENSSGDLLQTFSIPPDEISIEPVGKQTTVEPVNDQTTVPVDFYRGEINSESVPANIKKPGTILYDQKNKDMWIDGEACFPSVQSSKYTNLSIIILTKDEFDNIETKDPSTLYLIKSS